MRFWKGHALGNDYLVVDGASPPPTPAIRSLCDRNRGVGADGILLVDIAAEPVALRIFNPDGSEAEKSGNGLRIVGAWLHARELAGDTPFLVALPGETVEMAVEAVGPDGARRVRVDMGRASFRAGDVHYAGAGADEEVMGRAVDVAGEFVGIHLVSMGNPHCVVFTDDLDTDRFRRLAPRIQASADFERGVNVQFARLAAPDRLEALIHERGAGETLASGSSACAVAAAARRSGRTDARAFAVHMAGGTVRVEVDDDWRVRLTGDAIMLFEGQSVPGWP